MSRNNGRDYEVGYGKPPRNTQFKKGQSGISTRPAVGIKEPGDIGQCGAE